MLFTLFYILLIFFLCFMYEVIYMSFFFSWLLFAHPCIRPKFVSDDLTDKLALAWKDHLNEIDLWDLVKVFKRHH